MLVAALLTGIFGELRNAASGYWDSASYSKWRIIDFFRDVKLAAFIKILGPQSLNKRICLFYLDYMIKNRKKITNQVGGVNEDTYFRGHRHAWE